MTPSQQTIIQFNSISKKFGSRWANKNISFDILAGQVHGIIGENGAGKSTIMKILFGLYQADKGEIFLRNQKVEIKSPLEAFKNKIGMVHQHFMLSPEHTALENILLIQNQQKALEVYSQGLKTESIKAKAKEYGFEIPWDEKVKNLSVGVQQRIEILKLLNLDHEILIFDEPTAVLTPQEIEDLLKQIDSLRQKGKTVILITHKLKEVKKICDKITIFKKGEHVGTYANAELSEVSMAEKMVGHQVEFNKREFKKFANPKVLLDLQNISFEKNNHAFYFSLSLIEGEILGITGIEGNGQNELIQFLLDPQSFVIKKADEKYQLQTESLLGFSKNQIRQKSIGVFPEDRLHLGVITSQMAYENFILGYQRFKEWCSHGLLKWDRIKKITQEQFQQFKVEPNEISLPFSSYSGGNQQKIVVARELLQNPKFILAAHPTRGVDIGAIEFIHEKLIQSQERGSGILLISSELDELTKLSDRILVIRNGKFVKELQRHEFDDSVIGRHMLGSIESKPNQEGQL